MKLKLLFLSIITLCSVALTSCSKDNDSNFNYSMEFLYGTWSGTSVQVNGGWVNITEYPYTEFGFSIKFNPDGTYFGSGYFGNGSGTYSAKGNTITTYVGGEVYAKYEILSLSDKEVTATMTMETSSMNLKASKK